MDPENKEEANEFGKVVDILHNKAKLSSLRTYKGDVSEFIKEKDQSVASIIVKEKEKKEEEIQKEKEKKEEQKPKIEILEKPKNGYFKKNAIAVLLSLLLIAAGAAGFSYVFDALKNRVTKEVVLEGEIIPYNNLIALENITSETLVSELAKLALSDGINIVKVSEAENQPISKAEDFFSSMGITLPSALERALEDEYAIGAVSDEKGNSFFVVITVDDYGRAFSAMLEWESTMIEDLSFLNIAPAVVATSATTTPKANIPQGNFTWKDVIVKNKDTRALMNEKKQAKIAYTFLDKNTILITGTTAAIGDISTAYTSRSFVR